MSNSAARSVALLCASAFLAIVLILVSWSAIDDLAHAASAFRGSRLPTAAGTDVPLSLLSQPPHLPFLLVVAGVIAALAILAAALHRGRPQVLTALAFLAAGAELLCLVALFDLASRGVSLGIAYRVWRSPQAGLVRHADSELRLLALALLVPIFLAASGGILTFARRAQPSGSLAPDGSR